MTQSQIAEEIGVSQMHVSRLLNRTLEQLRDSLSEASDPVGPVSHNSVRVRTRQASSPSERRRPSRVEAARARTSSATTDQPDRERPGGAAAEVPGQTALDQLGEQHRSRAPRRAGVQPPGAQQQPGAVGDEEQPPSSPPSPAGRRRGASGSASPKASSEQTLHDGQAGRDGPAAAGRSVPRSTATGWSGPPPAGPAGDRGRHPVSHAPLQTSRPTAAYCRASL